jgi:hypothetical protein
VDPTGSLFHSHTLSSSLTLSLSLSLTLSHTQRQQQILLDHVVCLYSCCISFVQNPIFGVTLCPDAVGVFREYVIYDSVSHLLCIPCFL